MTEIIKLENELLRRLKLKKKNNHVYYAQDYPFLFQWNDINKLIKIAREKSVYKLRVCLHQEDKAIVHEMIIMLLKPQRINPHKQEKTTVSYHVLEGSAELKLYNDNGKENLSMNLSSRKSGIQHVRLEANKFRSIRSISNSFVYLEIANGPFRDSDTIWL